ncbi:Transcriptional regulator of nonfermentable carbon utilization [Phlyctochytrium planicorne]|nr:Transcriptional regulator of nonfermentable carbon utilization [Phlyctochytrium planicorne]
MVVPMPTTIAAAAAATNNSSYNDSTFQPSISSAALKFRNRQQQQQQLDLANTPLQLSNNAFLSSMDQQMSDNYAQWMQILSMANAPASPFDFSPAGDMTMHSFPFGSSTSSTSQDGILHERRTSTLSLVSDSVCMSSPSSDSYDSDVAGFMGLLGNGIDSIEDVGLFDHNLNSSQRAHRLQQQQQRQHQQNQHQRHKQQQQSFHKDSIIVPTTSPTGDSFHSMISSDPLFGSFSLSDISMPSSSHQQTHSHQQHNNNQTSPPPPTFSFSTTPQPSSPPPTPFDTEPASTVSPFFTFKQQDIAPVSPASSSGSTVEHRRPGRPKGSVNKIKKRVRDSDDEGSASKASPAKRGRKPKSSNDKVGSGKETLTVQAPMVSSSASSIVVDPVSMCLPNPSSKPLAHPSEINPPSNADIKPVTSIDTPATTTASLLDMARSISTLITPPTAETVPETHDDRWAYRHLLADARARLGRWEQARLLWSLASLRPILLSQWSQTSSTPSDKILKELFLRRKIADLKSMIDVSGTPSACWRGEDGGELLLLGAEFLTMLGYDSGDLMDEASGRAKLITDVMDPCSVVEYWEAFSSLCKGNAPRGVRTPLPGGKKDDEGLSSTIVEESGIKGRCTLIKKDGGPVPCAFFLTVQRDVVGGRGVVVGQFLPIGRW